MAGSEAVALNWALSLATAPEFGAPYPPIVTWARAGAKVLGGVKDVVRDKSSAFEVEISWRPTQDIVKECAHDTAYAYIGGVPTDALAGHPRRVPKEVSALSVADGPWVVETGSMYDLLFVGKVHGLPVKAATARLNAADGSVYEWSVDGAWKKMALVQMGRREAPVFIAPSGKWAEARVDVTPGVAVGHRVPPIGLKDIKRWPAGSVENYAGPEDKVLQVDTDA